MHIANHFSNKPLARLRVIAATALFGISLAVASFGSVSAATIGNHSSVINGNILNSYSQMNDANGGFVKQVAFKDGNYNEAYTQSLSSSPDGQRMVFLAQPTPTTQNPTTLDRVYVSNQDFTDYHVIAQKPAGVTYRRVAWSPDGQTIALFTGIPSNSTSTMQVTFMRTDGTVTSQVTLPSDTRSISWLPNSQQILYFFYLNGGTVSGTPELCTFTISTQFSTCNDLPSTSSFTPAADNYTYWSADVSPDGSHVLLTLNGTGTLEMLYVSDLDGGNLTAAVQANYSATIIAHPVWSPDGSKILYQLTSASGTTQLRTVKPDGTGDQQLINNAFSGNIVWFPKVVCTSSPFSDVSASSAFCPAIDWAVTNSITQGYSDGTFQPTTAVSRQAMAAFLYRLANPGQSLPKCTTSSFTDVPTSNPFCGAINWMVAQGITQGYSDGTFQPTTAVSRQAMAAFLYRMSHPGQTAPSCTSSPFSDVPVSSAFCGAINWMVAQGITQGYSDGTFQPTTAVSRQATMMFLYRYSVE
ncbi:MAG TPA: S-layer homology domain-containing protein [Candidatus Saccharimonadales bacterium]